MSEEIRNKENENGEIEKVEIVTLEPEEKKSGSDTLFKVGLVAVGAGLTWLGCKLKKKKQEANKKKLIEDLKKEGYRVYAPDEAPVRDINPIPIEEWTDENVDEEQ